MKVEALQQIDRGQARELWQKYQSHVHRQTPADAEIAAIYKRIAQGKTVIRALESIKAAGLNEQGMPRLAIGRADMFKVFWRTHHGYGRFQEERWSRNNAARSKNIQVEWPEITVQHREGEAIVPLVPIHMRPKRGLQNYHILWEAEWSKTYPADPYLLRRFGGDAWLVVAAWDLTDVERAVMSQRVKS
jgi:hypothetical protein